jgi:hypothetical protein
MINRARKPFTPNPRTHLGHHHGDIVHLSINEYQLINLAVHVGVQHGSAPPRRRLGRKPHHQVCNGSSSRPFSPDHGYEADNRLEAHEALGRVDEARFISLEIQLPERICESRLVRNLLPGSFVHLHFGMFPLCTAASLDAVRDSPGNFGTGASDI